MKDLKWNVLVTGGAGYVGTVLVPKLLDARATGSRCSISSSTATVLDAVAAIRACDSQGRHPRPATLAEALPGCDAVIHLACISNDPCFELDPDARQVDQLRRFRPLVRAAKNAGVQRFIYASSSSVYGVKDEDKSPRICRSSR